ncbi:hypothetical protein [Massilia sp. 9096]|uniref:hypothetical protein n=1 Tax=Massilia sp. 9096 TaxID=1500894 RepID=UPI00056B894F|nr:hypothetical protein [Massilia sp. 9096]
MTWLDRVLVLSIALLLSLQVMVSGHHKDDPKGYGDNCPSCVFAHHLPSGLPEVNPVPVPVTMAQRYRVEQVAVHQAPSYASFLIPKSQAPPHG